MFGEAYILGVVLLGAGFIFLVSFLVERGEKRTQFRMTSIGALVLAVLGFFAQMLFALFMRG